jgi:hypothetical protein
VVLLSVAVVGEGVVVDVAAAAVVFAGIPEGAVECAVIPEAVECGVIPVAVAGVIMAVEVTAITGVTGGDIMVTDMAVLE